MSYILVGSTDSMQLQLPSKGTTNWEQTLRLGTFQPLAVHDHVHSNGVSAGRGAPITDLSLLLNNGGYLLGRNAANSANVEILKINATDLVEIKPHVCQEVRSTLSVTLSTSSTVAIDDTEITSPTQSANIQYSLKKASSTSIVQGTIYLCQQGLSYSETSHDTALLGSGLTPYITGTQIQFALSSNKLQITNNSASETYTLYLHIVRLG
jgi:hypothetical protein